MKYMTIIILLLSSPTYSASLILKGEITNPTCNIALENLILTSHKIINNCSKDFSKKEKHIYTKENKIIKRKIITITYL